MLVPVLAALALAVTPEPAGDPWPMHTIDNTSEGADGVRLADFDGDGLPDIATGWEEGGVVRIYRNPGPERVREPWPMVEIAQVRSPERRLPISMTARWTSSVARARAGSLDGRRRSGTTWTPSAWTTEACPPPISMTQWMYCLPMRWATQHRRSRIEEF